MNAKGTQNQEGSMEKVVKIAVSDAGGTRVLGVLGGAPGHSTSTSWLECICAACEAAYVDPRDKGGAK